MIPQRNEKEYQTEWKKFICCHRAWKSQYVCIYLEWESNYITTTNEKRIMLPQRMEMWKRNCGTTKTAKLSYQKERDLKTYYHQIWDSNYVAIDFTTYGIGEPHDITRDGKAITVVSGRYLMLPQFTNTCHHRRKLKITVLSRFNNILKNMKAKET